MSEGVEDQVYGCTGSIQLGANVEGGNGLQGFRCSYPSLSSFARTHMADTSFEADLRTARDAANVSLEAIQLETRVPADVIKRLESGELMQDPSFNDVYLRALLRSYATAVGLSPTAVLDAFHAAQEGTYRGLLRPGQDAGSGGAEREAPRSLTDSKQVEGEQDASPIDSEPSTSADREAPHQSKSEPTIAPAVAALSTEGDEKESKQPKSVQPSRTEKQRVATTAALNAPRSFDRSWSLILGVTVVVLIAVIGVLWVLFRSDSPTPEVAQVAAADTTETRDFLSEDSSSVDLELSDTTQPGPTLLLPIEVTVRAKPSGDGLQNFRVTEAPDARRPYWMNPGDEQTFSSNEELVLWGEGAEGMDPEEVTIVWQGMAFDPVRGRVLTINPQNGQRLLDSLSAAGNRPN